MELKERKLINNTKDLPGYSNGLDAKLEEEYQIDYKGYAQNNIQDTLSMLNKKKKALPIKNLQGIGTAVTSTLDFGLSIGNAGSYNKSQDDLNAQAGMSQLSTGGYGYQVQNAVNAQQEMDEVKALNNAETLGLATKGASTGAAVGSLLGPVGGAVGSVVGGIAGFVGGLLGSKKRKRRAEEALRRQQYEAGMTTEFNRARANTSRLTDAYAQEYGNEEAQYLSSGFYNGKQPVYSAFGETNAEPDSRVSKGEVAIDTRTGSRYRIPTGPNDTALFAGGKNPYTAIITNKYGLSDIAMEDPNTAIALQGALKENGMLGKNKQGYKCGKMPKYKLGLSPYNDDPPFEYEMPWEKEDEQFLFDYGLDDIIDHSITPVTKDGGILNAPTVLGKDKRKPTLNTPATSSKLYGMPGLFMDPTKQYGPIWGGTNMSMPKGSSMADRAPKSPKNTIGLFMDPSKLYGPIWGDPIETMKLNPVQSAYNTESSPEFKTPSLTVDVPRVKPQNVSALAGEPGTPEKKNKKSLKSKSGLLSPIPNIATTALGMYLGNKMYNEESKAYRPNYRVRNEKAQAMNDLLAKNLRPNELPIINNMLQAQAYANYMIQNSGGLSAGLKNLSRLANARNTQTSINNALAGLLDKYFNNLKYYTGSVTQQGAQDAINDLTAMRASDAVYMADRDRIDAKKWKGLGTILSTAQLGIANDINRRIFNNTYGLYAV